MITHLLPNEIFVFGSNLSGIHGAGTAKYAFEHFGAKWGEGDGLMGQSYAIPTKDRNIKTLPLNHIKLYVDDFLTFAELHQDKTFLITPIGCGLAGYNAKQIAPMFKNAPSNCVLPPEFIEELNR